jgi:GAF domain-containing protein
MSDTDFETLVAQASALVADEHDGLANTANLIALLFDAMEGLNWAGVYLRRGDELVLGPFQGKLACVRIGWGQGVCGAAAAQARVLRVADVHTFDGHIACDSASESEIVLPLHEGDHVFGVLDLDSPRKGRFSESDERGLIAFRDVLQGAIRRDPATLGLTLNA